MKIKEKLIELGIDVENDKEKVNLAKKALKEKGYKADRIIANLDMEGEYLLEDLFKSKPVLSKDNVIAPPTIKKDEDMPINSSKNKKHKTKVAINSVEEEKKEEKNGDDEVIPFWKNNLLNNKTNIKIKFSNGSNQVKEKNSSPNGRPLPQKTIVELEKKKNEIENKLQTKKDDIKTNKNVKVEKQIKPNINKTKQNEGLKTNNILNKTNDKKISLNKSNTNLVLGTNSRFVGKQKDKNKFNKDYEQKKDTKVIKTKEKHKNSFLNENEQYAKRKKKNTSGAFVKPVVKDDNPASDIKSIVLPEIISIKDLAAKLKIQPATIVKKLFLAGQMVTANHELSFQEAENIAIEYNILCEKEEKIDVIAELLKDSVEDTEENLVLRPPVVCVMGHVDHGKTSILDAIRKTNIIDKEAGGITQHIGAYQVKYNDRYITFLDTPGHEAFTAMRLRGAKSTDIAVLVVAADDGVMPQTIEAINHAKAANVEIVVAINKIDKPEANVERVKQALSEYELIPADWGGQTTFCEVSAKKNIGISNLMEMILLTADVMELKANPNRKARGIVIEGELDKGKGPVGRIIVQKGTLKVGDYIAMGKSYGKVRAMIDCNGNKIDKAMPSTPVEILGLNDTPTAGDIFVSFDTEKEARNFAITFISENKQKLVEDSKKNLTLDALFEQIKSGEVKELPIVLKADVVGSVEALKDSLEKLSNDEVSVRIIHNGVGNINESDINLAVASNAVVIGFNTKIDPQIKNLIDSEKVDVRIYDIIYKVIEDIEKAIKGMLEPVFVEKVQGHLTIRQIFKSSNVGNIAGCIVNDGEITRNSKVRIYRNNDIIYEGAISSLKRFKDEVKEVKTGFECGVVFENFNDFQTEDTIESYIMINPNTI